LRIPNTNYTALKTAFLIDLKSQTTNFATAHNIGKLLRDGRELFKQLPPERERLFLGLTDMKKIIWIRITKIKSNFLKLIYQQGTMVLMVMSMYDILI
jgi:hypothetical protein